MLDQPRDSEEFELRLPCAADPAACANEDGGEVELLEGVFCVNGIGGTVVARARGGGGAVAPGDVLVAINGAPVEDLWLEEIADLMLAGGGGGGGGGGARAGKGGGWDGRA